MNYYILRWYQARRICCPDQWSWAGFWQRRSLNYMISDKGSFLQQLTVSLVAAQHLHTLYIEFLPTPEVSLWINKATKRNVPFLLILTYNLTWLIWVTDTWFHTLVGLQSDELEGRSEQATEQSSSKTTVPCVRQTTTISATTS